MLRLFLRLFLVMTIGLVLALQTVDRTFDALLDGEMQHYNQRRCVVRPGRWSSNCVAWTIRPRSDNWKPCGLTTAWALPWLSAINSSLSTQEKAELSQGLLVMRDQYTQFISRIDDGSQLLSIKLPAEPSLMPFYITVAYMMIAIMIGFVLFFWVRPHWRDLEKLRLAAERWWQRSVGAYSVVQAVRTFATWPNISI